MFGKQRKQVWGRSAQQAEDCEAIPKKPGDGRWSLLQSDGFWLFHSPRRLFAINHKLNWRKLLENVFKLVRPLESRGLGAPGKTACGSLSAESGPAGPGRRPLAQSERARSARKGCLWQAFSVERAGRPRARRPPTSPPANFCFSVSCFNQGIVSDDRQTYC